MGPHPPPPFDPYPDESPDRPGQEVLSEYFYAIESLLDFIFENPPGPIQGEWLDNREFAWRELKPQVAGVGGRLSAELEREAVERREALQPQSGLYTFRTS